MTLSELCDLSDKQPKILQGKSLAGLIKEGKELGRESIGYTVSNGGRSGTIRTNDWRYTRWGSDSELNNEELYYHVNDPEELKNLVNKPERHEKLLKMRELFDSYKSNIVKN